MSDSSRASIAPFSRPPSSSRPVPPSLGQNLWRRHLVVGVTLGMFLSLPALVRAFQGPGTWQSATLSAIFSAVLAALFISVSAASVFGICLLVPRFKGWAHPASAVFGAGCACTYVTLRGMGEAFRISSESPVNLGTLEFIQASFWQLSGPILAEYASVTLALAVLVVACSSLVFLYLGRPLEGCRRPWEILARAGLSGLVLVGFLHALASPGLAQESGLDKTADLALLASVASRAEQRAEVEENARRLGVVVRRGARLSAGDIWQKATPHLEGPRPNVVLLMLESVGVNHLGYMGYKRSVTPELDRIAARSRRYRNARSTASHSNYAQMAVLSSLFPRRFSGFDAYSRLDYPRFLWHDFLTAFGYRTATHSSQDETWQGMLRFQATGTPTEYHHARNYDGKRIRMGSEKIVPDEVTVTRAIQWIEGAKEPFGLYVNLQSTHFPYRVPPGAPAPYQPTRPTRGKFHYLNYPASDVPVVINRYDNALAYVDKQVGRLFSYLERTGRLSNTVFVVTSDHGESFGENGLVTHGRSLFEEEVRVPLLIHYPMDVAPGDDLRRASTLDILPTISQLLEAPPHPSFQGSSLLEAVDPRRPVFMNIQGMKSADAVVCGRYKFILNRSAETESLFDLEADPQEERNLALERRSISDKLETLLRAQMRTQMRYHHPSNESLRSEHFAPRLASCPDLEEHFLNEPEPDTKDLHAAAIGR